MSEVTSLIYHDITENSLRGKQLRNFSPLDIWLSGTYLLAMVTSGVWIARTNEMQSVFVVVFFELLFGVGLMWRFNEAYARNYDVIVRDTYRAIRHRLIGYVLWQNPSTDTSNRFVKWLRGRNGVRRPFPYHYTVVHAAIDGREHRVALKRDRSSGFDYAYIRVVGGAFASCDAMRQDELVRMLADEFDRAIARADLKLGIGMIHSAGPEDATQITDYFKDNLNPFVALSSQFDIADEKTRRWVEKARSSIDQLRPAMMNSGATRPFSLIEIAVKRDRRAWKSARQGKASDEDLYSLPIVSFCTSLADSLRRSYDFEFEEVKVMGLADIAEYDRCAWDVVNIQDFYQARRRGVIPTNDEMIDQLLEKVGIEELDKYLDYLPTEIIELDPRGRWLRIDDNYFSALRVTQLPRKMRADQTLSLEHIIPAGMWVRSATIGMPFSGDTETTSILVRSSLEANLANAFKGETVVADPRRGRRARQLAEQAETAATYAIAQDYNKLYVVAASDSRTVLSQRAELKAELMKSKVRAKEVNYGVRLFDVIITGLFGVSRI